MEWIKHKQGVMNKNLRAIAEGKKPEKHKSLAALAQISGALHAYSNCNAKKNPNLNTTYKDGQKNNVINSTSSPAIGSDIDINRIEGKVTMDELENENGNNDSAQRSLVDLRKNHLYLDLVAEQGREVFNWANDSDIDSNHSQGGMGESSPITVNTDADSPIFFNVEGVINTIAPLRAKKLMKRRDATESSDSFVPSSLPHTPSMAMLNEAALALRESPSALTKMSVESTGGVYQLRRRQPVSLWETENTSTESSPASINSARTCTGTASFSNLRNFSSSPKRKSGLRHMQTAQLLQPADSDGKSNKSNLVQEGRKRAGTAEDVNRQHVQLMRRRSRDVRDIERNLFNRHRRRQKYNSGSCRTGRSGSAPPRNRVERGESKLAVFKPEDEETGAQRQLRLGDKNPERAGMVIGGGAKRERAAYVLDKLYFGFSKVPPTLLTQVTSHDTTKDRTKVKRGSLQRYCPSEGSAEEKPDLVFRAKCTEVHRIGILDLRIFNTDRHAGNILCQLNKKRDGKDEVLLIPIDHALSLPDYRFLGEAYFDWVYWKQSEEKFDANTLEYINKIDVHKDADALREINIPETCIATNIICTTALKVGASFGLSLHDLGAVFQRPFMAGHPDHDKYLSPLEYMIIIASENVNFEYDIGAQSTSLEEEEHDNANSDMGEMQVLATSHMSDDSPIVSKTERVGIDLNSDNEEEEEDDEFDEGRVFGNVPPPENLYQELEQVFRESFMNEKWREWLV
mmetsp:Transcript_22179/g.28339  ORF Transcript_22179/g.28339 Transcript_22179/m.28339 type:complete len:742 (+) Transcript_22179:558-2783(+)|eukprot:CAMPEP_0204867010 /NCGR_PEP_ID=MMETSP1348-20121228/20615_1 /ASSEMBLY_ACC=CAM_ASM_000700 /TAXON_ID=215587 /ORGANISM="Aplanochytrium stocchinoi, Strain GSBS06" /LENGTH=741 /DNA_ID=CAMNT_0052019227 /DNA_START=460 /DNA_END=2685 /DNA_ORIENTATION=+